ncbi:hypothetical protein JCM8097_000839 [Rhodosporidiobolus ruineniae]
MSSPKSPDTTPIGGFKGWLKGKNDVQVELARTGSWHGRSVSALFQVSSEFSALAAPYLFKELHLNWTDGGASSPLAADLLPFLPRLVGVRKLVLQLSSLEALWGYGGVAPHPQTLQAQYATAGLKSLPSSFTEIEANNVGRYYLTISSLTYIVSWRSATLRRLAISLDDRGTLTDLGEVISVAFNLTELVLDGQNFDYLSGTVGLFDLTATRHALAFLPPIKSLSIVSSYFHVSHIAFAAAFSPTLASLSLRSMASSRGVTAAFAQPKFTSEVFPLLQHFSLSGSDSICHETIDSITSSTFPVLTSVELDVRDVRDWSEDGDNPLLVFEKWPFLTRLKVTNLLTLTPADQTHISLFCAEHELELKTTLEDQLDMPSPTALSKAVPTLASSLRTTLDYVREGVDGAETGGDSARLERVRRILEPLELERQSNEAWDRA